MIRTDQDAFLDSISKSVASPMALKGCKCITDTQTHVGPFYAITIIEDAVFNPDNMTGCNIEGLAADTFPTGITIMGHFPQVDLTSGKVLAYKK